MKTDVKENAQMTDSSLLLSEIVMNSEIHLDIDPTASKQDIFSTIGEFLKKLNLTVVKDDQSRPWGGFFVIDEREARQFAQLFFPGVNIDELKISEKLSPKILVVQPGKRLSWQYHHRRAEIWKLIGGEAGVAKSDSDEEQPAAKLMLGQTVKLHCGERHRLVGLNSWGVIAEIWQHVDAANPSDEEDIVRVQDDFGR